jgi:uncharacterized protein (TIGR00255 family)
MSSYGSSVVDSDWGRVSIDIKSSIGKSYDVNVRLPKFLQRYEYDITSILSRYVNRGVVDISVNIVGLRSIRKLHVDWELASQYRQVAKLVRTQFLCDDDCNVVALLRSPEVSTVVYDDKVVLPIVLRATEQACVALDKFATDQGSQLLDRLVQLMSKLTVNVDQLVQVHDVQYQELYRAIDWIQQFKQDLVDKPTGRKLDLLLQEILREIVKLDDKLGSIESTKILIESKLILQSIKDTVRFVE